MAKIMCVRIAVRYTLEVMSSGSNENSAVTVERSCRVAVLLSESRDSSSYSHNKEDVSSLICSKTRRVVGFCKMSFLEKELRLAICKDFFESLDVKSLYPPLQGR